MPPSENGSGIQSLFLAIAAGAMALITTLVLASYGYTWAESNENRKEKTEWRKEHQQVLDNKFEEIKKNQDYIASKINEDNDKIKDLLKEIINEQKRSSQRIEGNKSNERERR